MLEDLDPQAVRTIVDYIYTTYITITRDNAVHLIAAAELLVVPGRYSNSVIIRSRGSRSTLHLIVHKFPFRHKRARPMLTCSTLCSWPTSKPQMFWCDVALRLTPTSHALTETSFRFRL